MPIMIRANTERNVPAAQVEKYKAAGYVLLNQGNSQNGPQEPQKEAGEENITEEKKGAEMGTEEAQGGQSEAENAPESTPENTGEVSEEDLKAMKVEELRKMAKDAGIQGYKNMNKETLIALIINH